MTAFFFGTAEEQLFGYYHSPRGVGSGAVLFCPSWGSEYQYAHRSLRVASRRLAELGFHAMRFDYSGTGDSWGSETDADMSRWIGDTAMAIDELKAMSGRSRVDLVGLRLGASVAAATATGRRDVRRLVLWDPVVDGKEWVRAVLASSAGLLTGRDGTVEFGQRLVSASLVAQMEAVDAADYRGSTADRALLLETHADGGRNFARLSDALTRIEHQVVEDAHAWEEDDSIWNGMVPSRAIGSLMAWLRAT